MSEHLVTPTLILMNAFLILIGIPLEKIVLVSSVILLSHISQIFSSYILKWANSRKKATIILSIVQHLAFGSTAFVVGIPKIGFALLCIFYFLGFSCKQIKNAIVIDWTTKFVEPSKAGRYFSKRNVIINFISMMYNSVFGILIEKFGDNKEFFLISFSLILVFGIIDIVSCLNISDDKESVTSNITKISEVFTIPIKNRKFICYIVFSLIWFFGLYLSQPYYTYYFTNVVGIGYSIVGFVIAFTNIIKILIGRVWGGAVDKFGYKKIIVICGIVYGIVNILFCFIAPNTIFIYPILFLFQGIFMIGFNVTKFNMMIKIIPQSSRITYMNFEGIFLGIVSFAAPQIADILIKIIISNNFKLLFFNSYQTIFIIGGLIQISAIVFFILNVKKDK